MGSFGSLQAGREAGSTLALAWDPTPVSVAGSRGYVQMEQRSQRCLSDPEAQTPPPGPCWSWDPRNSQGLLGLSYLLPNLGLETLT